MTQPARAVIDGVDLDAVAAAVRSCPAIDDLSSGPWGGVVSYLPGRQLAGLRVASDHVLISVRGRWGVPGRGELAGEVRSVWPGWWRPRRVDLEVADLAGSGPDCARARAAGPGPGRRGRAAGAGAAGAGRELRPGAGAWPTERSRRHARREFIRGHHPDRGGDPAVFAAGLAALTGAPSGEPARPGW